MLKHIYLTMWGVRQFRTLFFRPDAGHTTSTITQTELPIVQAITVSTAFPWASPFLAIFAIPNSISLPWRALIRFYEAMVRSRSQIAKDVFTCFQRNKYIKTPLIALYKNSLSMSAAGSIRFIPCLLFEPKLL